MTGPFLCLGTERRTAWSLEEQQRRVGEGDQALGVVRGRVGGLLATLGAGGQARVRPLSLGCRGAKLGGRLGGKLDSVWVGPSKHLLFTYFNFP